MRRKLMRCFDTLSGFVVFFVIGLLLTLLPRKARDAQAFIRSKIPYGHLVPLGWTMKRDWSVTVVRVQGMFFLAFSLFLLGWYLTHCVQ
jgi:hypothetical protein